MTVELPSPEDIQAGFDKVTKAISELTTEITQALSSLATTNSALVKALQQLDEELKAQQKPPTTTPPSTTPPTTTPTPTKKRFSVDPGPGVVKVGAAPLGGTSMTPDQVKARETAYAKSIGKDWRPVQWRRTYYTAAQITKMVQVANADIDAGRVPVLSIKLPGTWKDVAAGKYPKFGPDLAAGLKSIKGPHVIAVHHEPEKDDSDNPAEWVAAQKYLTPFVRQSAQTTWTFILTSYDTFNDPKYSFDKYFTPDLYDMIGFDGYPQDNIASRATPMNELSKKYGLPFFIAEYALSDVTWAKGKSASFFADGQKFLEGTKNCVAWLYYDTSANAKPDEIFDLSGEKMVAYAKVLHAQPKG